MAPCRHYCDRESPCSHHWGQGIESHQCNYLSVYKNMMEISKYGKRCIHKLAIVKIGVFGMSGSKISHIWALPRLYLNPQGIWLQRMSFTKSKPICIFKENLWLFKSVKWPWSHPEDLFYPELKLLKIPVEKACLQLIKEVRYTHLEYIATSDDVHIL